MGSIYQNWVFIILISSSIFKVSHSYVFNFEFLDRVTPQISKFVDTSKKSLFDCTQDYFASQLVDHFNKSDNRTWPQRYFYGQNCFEDGGPLILEIGGEWEITCHNSPARKLACALKGLYIYVEHRYYGASFPLTPHKTINRSQPTIDQLKYLSSRQAVADIARLREHVNTENKQTYVVGCSYGGSLAYWVRQMHPELIDAAFALSPPLQAQLDFRDYWKLSAQTLNKLSNSSCGDYLMSRDFENELYTIFDIKMFDPDSLRDFETKAGLCPYSLNGLCMADKIVHYLVKEYGQQVYSYAQTAHSFTSSINSTCNATRNIEKDIQKFMHLKFPTLLNKAKKCVDAYKFHQTFFTGKMVAQKQLEAKKDRLDNHAWFWQKCTEFGWMKPDAVESIESYTNRMCKKYNMGYYRVVRNIQETNDHYKLDSYYDDYTMIINGEHDPWRKLSEKAYTQKHVEKGISHCPDTQNVIELMTDNLVHWFDWLSDWTGRKVKPEKETNNHVISQFKSRS